MDLVSVVITTYKRIYELERALRSLLNQTYKSIEIIIVDDNVDEEISIKVRQIVDKYLDKANILYKKNEQNLGGALSRNEGLKLSKGKYIAFFDDDDEYLPEKIEEQVKQFEKTEYGNLGLVYCFTEAVDEHGKIIHVYENHVRGKFVYESMLNTVAATTQWLCLKSAIDSIGGFRDVPCKQDTTLLIDLALAGYEIDFVPKVLCKYYETQIERISNFGPKRINGELLLISHIRENYGNLTQRKIDNIEYSHSYVLYDLYLNNFRIKEAKRELKFLVRQKNGVIKKVKLIVYFPYKLIRKWFGKHIISKRRI